MLLLTALTLPLLLGMTSVAVDCGSLYLEKSRLQNAADAAALAGAQKMGELQVQQETESNLHSLDSLKPIAAKTAAFYAEKNSQGKQVFYEIDTSMATYQTEIEETHRLFLLDKLLNQKEVTIKAKAKARYEITGDMWTRTITFRKSCKVAANGKDIRFDGSIAAVGNISPWYQQLAKEEHPFSNAENTDYYEIYDAASNTYKHMRLVPDEQAYLFDQNMQDHINRLRARRSIYIPDQSLDGNLSKTNHGQIPRQVSQFDPEIDLSQWDGQIVELRYYSNKFKLTRPLSHLTYVIVDGGDSIVFDVSNDYTNNNLVLIYSPTDTEYSTTDAETYNSDGKDGNRADPVYKTKKAKISHLAKSSIKFINSDPSGQSHTFSGAIYAPFGEVDFTAPGSSRDSALGFDESSNGLINFNGSIVADRVHVGGQTAGYFRYNPRYASLFPNKTDKGKTRVIATLLEE